MATHALRRSGLPRAEALASTPAGTVALLVVLLGASLVLRTRALDAGFWIDEGLTVGISSYPIAEIPGVLRQDGSPPLYYFLLHLWMDAFGTSEAATHALSVMFALLAIPAALWAGWSLFGRRAGWIAAVLTALNPFLTIYAQETRMYSLVILLGLLGTATFVHAFVFRRRRYVAAFAVVLAAMLYTHNWALFFVVGALAALTVCYRESRERTLLGDAALAFGAAGLAFLPWLPTLLFQARHTGAPWSNPPSPVELVGGIGVVLSGEGALVALFLAGGLGLLEVVRRRGGPDRTALFAMVAIGAGTLLSGWLYSQFSPAWANRYLGVLVGPLILLAAFGLPRAGRFGLVALVLVVLFWASYFAPDEKSNVNAIGKTFSVSVGAGDLVISTQPEQVPVLEYYLPPGLSYATPLGRVVDPTVMDWRDALSRLQDSSVARNLEPILAALPVGADVMLVVPVVRDRDAWTSPWTSLVLRRSEEWSLALAGDERFTRTQVFQPAYTEPVPRALRIDLYTKTRSE
ncbi:MAG: glycosyltransferase family 39 protein [Actinobacteria bacterium]|nr:glycosyltransferase family 39 protein [Actinomycetota bacterium]